MRDKPTLITSLALLRYRADSGELSHFYWTGAAQSDYFAYVTKGHAREAKPIETLGIADPRFERRLGHNFSELRRRMDVEARWRRLLTLMLVSSAFERFVVSASSAALESDPLRAPGFPKRVDGLLLKKYGLDADLASHVGLVKGEWSKRLAEYRRLFGRVPEGLREVEGDLEKLRKTRNAIAHEFGFEASHASPQLHVALGARRVSALDAKKVDVSEQQLLSYFHALEVAAKAIDVHLTTEFVGGYEVAALYLEWLRDPAAFEKSASISMAPGAMGDPINRFGTAIGTLFDTTLNREYVPALKAFIDAL